ncbi:uncharacterized protein LOC112081883 [Eutrema salsugineum]|uniref:uncharacterized protein LOC112081883 n=1 Tax=Eutrema salsugineum TaxID=72664 RepID=UPI000CECFBBF|nr:uncharacterized protein LOC112081883 [Eutrema salsugineum]
MSSLTNEFNPYGDYTMNYGGFVPIQMNPNESQTVRTTFVPSVNTSRPNMVSPSPSFTSSYHDSQVSSPSLRANNPRVAYPMRSNMVPAVGTPCMPLISGFVHSQFSPVLITQTQTRFTKRTFTKRYHATVVPTNHMVTVQNGNERVERVMTSQSQPTISNPRFSHSHITHVCGKECLPIYPEPIDFIVSEQVPTGLQNLDLRDLSPNHRRHEQYVHEVGRPVKKFRNSTEFPGFADYKEDDGNAGRARGLPNENYGSNTCPMCKQLFGTSQILAARMESARGRNETNEGTNRGLCARTKKSYRNPNFQTVHGFSPQISPEAKVAEEKLSQQRGNK